MSSLNKVFLLGRLGKDPEVRYSPDNMAIASFSLATSMTSSKSGEKKEYTEWHRCVAFNKAGEVAGQYLKKGTQVLIEGSLRTRKWQDKEGRDQYTTEVVVGRLTMVGSRNTEHDDEPAETPQKPPAAGFNDLDDDYPF